MGTPDDILQLAQELLEDIELGRGTTTAHVRKASRLARLAGDEAAMRWLRFETLGVDSSDAGRAWMTHTRRWTDKDAGAGNWGSTPEIETRVQTLEAQLNATGAVSLSGDAIYATMRDHRAGQLKLSTLIMSFRTTLARVDSEVHAFATRVYQESRYSDLQQTLFEDSRAAVDARLRDLGGDVLTQIDSIADRIKAGDPEAISQAMTTCRRMIRSCADLLFPAQAAPYVMGEERLDVGEDKVLNRITAYVHLCGIGDSRRRRIRRSLGDLYERTSAGVHDELSIDEARYVFLMTYVTLGEVVTLESGNE